MNVTAGIAAAVIFAGAAVGFAGPSRAADDFSGTFIPNGPGLRSTWVVTPCGPDCTHIADSRSPQCPRAVRRSVLAWPKR